MPCRLREIQGVGTGGPWPVGDCDDADGGAVARHQDRR